MVGAKRDQDGTISDQGAKTTKPRKPRAKRTTKPEYTDSDSGQLPDAQTTPSSTAPATDAVSTNCAKERESNNEEQPNSQEPQNTDNSDGQQPPQTSQTDSKTDIGDVASVVAESATEYADSSPVARETRSHAANRWVLEGRRWETDRFRKDVIRQCRANGMSREEAGDHAWEACLAQFPLPGVSAIAIDLPDPAPFGAVAEPEFSPIGETVVDSPPKDDQGVPGLGDLPADWGILPANASLQVEISWVSANRLRVRDGSGVDLSKALSPAPSYSALSWLETSILFPSKFADISVKATANQDDEREAVRREKLSIEEIRGLLAEMLEG